MASQGYLTWAIENTKTVWWHDSAEPGELDLGLGRGAIGVTTNPVLTRLALGRNAQVWADEIREALRRNEDPELRAESLMRIVVTHAARKLEPEFDTSRQRMGYVCAQVNPGRAGDRDAMLPMARRFHQWAPNIAVKLPVTAAGLDVLEECIAEGITCTATVSFTVPQVIAIAERCRQGIRRAEEKDIAPGRCFAVIMIGRLDDYLREVAHDYQASITESDIRFAGVAVSKRAYSIYREREYEPILIIAALRGTYHMTELAGADLIMSIAPEHQQPLLSPDLPMEERIDAPVPPETLERLSSLPEFVRAFEPRGMTPRDFVTYGATQRTLSQFHEVGWKQLESFRLP